MLDNIVEEVSKECSARCPVNEPVLVMQDTTELNYHSNNGRLKVNDPDLGLISNNISTGLLSHVGLAISAKTHLPFGIAHVKTFHRGFDQDLLSKREKELLPLESKESFRWLETIDQSSKCLQKASEVTVVGDRENDIYEVYANGLNPKTHVLVRSRIDRKTQGGAKLSEVLSNQTWQGRKAIFIAGNQHRHGRSATLQFRWAEVALSVPDRKKSKDHPSSAKVWAVEVMEIPQSVPEGEEPVHWRLLTTHQVDSLQSGQQIVEWYTLRWLIEELFRVLKTGLNVEKSQLETGIALKKLIALSVQASWKILLLKQQREGKQQIAAATCFQPQEINLLKALQPTLEGKTLKQQNPFEKESLAWAGWLIARLGGWKPAPLEKRPYGVNSLYRGMRAFKTNLQGWTLAQQLRNNQSFPT